MARNNKYVLDLVRILVGNTNTINQSCFADTALLLSFVFCGWHSSYFIFTRALVKMQKRTIWARHNGYLFFWLIPRYNA